LYFYYSQNYVALFFFQGYQLFQHNDISFANFLLHINIPCDFEFARQRWASPAEGGSCAIA